MFWLFERIRSEPGAFEPEVQIVDVVGGRLALAKAKDIDQRQQERQCGYHERDGEAHLQCAEQEQEKHHEGERAAGNEPEQVAFQAPCPALGIVGAVRFRESKFVAHSKVPTSTVELWTPKAVNNARMMTGAPAMISSPMMESLPASVSPRRMANPPPITQMVPKIKPMSMTMPIAREAPWLRPVACARMGENSNALARSIVFMIALYPVCRSHQFR